MHDHNLDDLIINTIEPKNSKTKSFLTIIALAIVVLIIAIILTRIILKDPHTNQLLEENDTEIISPELSLQTDTPQKETIQKPLIPTTETIKPKINLEASSDTIEKNIPTKKETISTVEITNEFDTQKEIKRKQEEEIRQQKLEKQKQEAEAKVVSKQKETTPLVTEIVKKETNPLTAKNTYFIQVGSFSKTPSTQFLTIIKNSGFNYQITAPSATGTKKLLVGPYDNKAEVDSALIKVKDRINKNAYIIRK